MMYKMSLCGATALVPAIMTNQTDCLALQGLDQLHGMPKTLKLSNVRSSKFE